MPGGTGSLRPPSLLSSQNSSSVAGTQIGGGLSRQFGSNASSGPVSITAPDRMCAPMVDDFSITQTEISGLSCLRRMANESPAGPAPTVTTSYSMTSRSVSGVVSLMLAAPCRGSREGPGLSQIHRASVVHGP